MIFYAKYKFHILQTLKYLSILINSGSKTGSRYTCVGSKKGDVRGLLQAIQIYLRGEQRMELKGRLRVQGKKPEAHQKMSHGAFSWV